MKLVIALGGNALLQRGEPQEAHLQKANIDIAAKAIAEIAVQHSLVICHGNGPQVGLLALQNASYDQVAPYPLDVLVAETQSMIGYWLQQALQNRLSLEGVATIVTQTEVDANDPAFDAPTKPIGPIYDKAQSEALSQEHGWTMAPDNDAYRRVVPSPLPKSIIEIDAIKTLLHAEKTVICAGGGGIPVVKSTGKLQGIEAVIDKDRSSALLAALLDADAFVILTDVDGVYSDFGTDHAKRHPTLSLDDITAMNFAKGSMGPKVEACQQFVKQTGRFAAIGKLDQLSDILDNQAGTRITQ
jgi:carbamate kinase